MRAECASAARFLLQHLGSLHKAAHDAHEHAVNPTTLRHRVHEAEYTGRRGDERVSRGEHKAPQEALQLKRRELNLHVEGQGRRRLTQALRTDIQSSKDELAREMLLPAEERVPVVDEAGVPAKVVIEVLAPIRRRRDQHQVLFSLFSLVQHLALLISWTDPASPRTAGHVCDDGEILAWTTAQSTLF
jgi:hypothetical protein